MRKCPDYFVLESVRDYLLASGSMDFRTFSDACARWQSMYEILAWLVEEYDKAQDSGAEFPLEQVIRECRLVLSALEKMESLNA